MPASKRTTRVPGQPHLPGHHHDAGVAGVLPVPLVRKKPRVSANQAAPPCTPYSFRPNPRSFTKSTIVNLPRLRWRITTPICVLDGFRSPARFPFFSKFVREFSPVRLALTIFLVRILFTCIFASPMPFSDNAMSTHFRKAVVHLPPQSCPPRGGGGGVCIASPRTLPRTAQHSTGSQRYKSVRPHFSPQ
ncbi:hypothetical protein LIA77_02645 [Sarocladium implicatum]|nr:hypothetical protein LIA77_02645 [Sarocladium implicatum]